MQVIQKLVPLLRTGGVQSIVNNFTPSLKGFLQTGPLFNGPFIMSPIMTASMSTTSSMAAQAKAISGSSIFNDFVVTKVWTPLMMPVRTKIRNYFPRPSEVKRIRKHGYVIRLKTKGGRACIMRRILKGRHVLSH